MAVRAFPPCPPCLHHALPRKRCQTASVDVRAELGGAGPERVTVWLDRLAGCTGRPVMCVGTSQTRPGLRSCPRAQVQVPYRGLGRACQGMTGLFRSGDREWAPRSAGARWCALCVDGRRAAWTSMYAAVLAWCPCMRLGVAVDASKGLRHHRVRALIARAPGTPLASPLYQPYASLRAAVSGHRPPHDSRSNRADTSKRSPKLAKSPGTAGTWPAARFQNNGRAKAPKH